MPTLERSPCARPPCERCRIDFDSGYPCSGCGEVRWRDPIYQSPVCVISCHAIVRSLSRQIRCIVSANVSSSTPTWARIWNSACFRNRVIGNFIFAEHYIGLYYIAFLLTLCRSYCEKKAVFICLIFYIRPLTYCFMLLWRWHDAHRKQTYTLYYAISEIQIQTVTYCCSFLFVARRARPNI